MVTIHGREYVLQEVAEDAHPGGQSDMQLEELEGDQGREHVATAPLLRGPGT